MNFYLYRIKYYNDIIECQEEKAGLTVGDCFGAALERVLETYGEASAAECELHQLAFEDIVTLDELKGVLESDIDD